MIVRKRRASAFDDGGPFFGVATDTVDGDESARFALLAVVVTVALVVLAGRLAYLQLVGGSGYRDIATGNRIRVIETPAPRGRIIDAGGRVLAGSRSSYTVTMDWEALIGLDADERDVIFVTLAAALDGAGAPLAVDTISEKFDRAAGRALEPVVLVEDVSPELWIALGELSLPGIAAVSRPIRIYPYGAAAGHALGYMGTVADTEEAAALDQLEPELRYRPGSEIGRAGLERIFEHRLRGTPEIRRVEVDARNRVIRTVEVAQRAVPGNDLHLTIDIDLQRAAESALQDQLQATSADPETPAPAGSFVVIDPADGAVLALASMPGFDPTAFVFGLDEDETAELLSAGPDPFLNRATNGLYPPGSTFKPVPAYAALTTGARGQDELWQDAGSHRLRGCRASNGDDGCVFRNAGGAVLGSVDLRQALARSSDTYFYSLGEKFWVERDRYGDEVMQDVAVRFGLGRPTGIELPAEAAGRVPGPRSRQADHDRFPEAFPDPRWYTGDNVNLAIGQGDLLVTPLQLANLYATLAASGTRHQPRLVDRLVDGSTGETVLAFAPRRVEGEPLDPVAVDAIVDGLLNVPIDGTAASAFEGFPTDRFAVAAKTGTAEMRGKADNALFAGFAPVPEPRYAFAVVMEESGFGGVAAAPVARRFFEWVLAGQASPTGPAAPSPPVALGPAAFPLASTTAGPAWSVPS